MFTRFSKPFSIPPDYRAQDHSRPLWLHRLHRAACSATCLNSQCLSFNSQLQDWSHTRPRATPSYNIHPSMPCATPRHFNSRKRGQEQHSFLTVKVDVFLLLSYKPRNLNSQLRNKCSPLCGALPQLPPTQFASFGRLETRTCILKQSK